MSVGGLITKRERARSLVINERGRIRCGTRRVCGACSLPCSPLLPSARLASPNYSINHTRRFLHEVYQLNIIPAEIEEDKIADSLESPGRFNAAIVCIILSI